MNAATYLDHVGAARARDTRRVSDHRRLAVRLVIAALALLLCHFSPGAHAASTCDSNFLPLLPLKTGALTPLTRPVPGSASSIALDYIFVQPADTNPAISCSTTDPSSAGLHYAVIPKNCVGCSASPVATIFFGGSTTVPAAYADISNEAASMGYAVLDLAYVQTVSANSGLNDKTAAEVCGDAIPLTDTNMCSASGPQTTTACFTYFHSEVVFGRYTRYNKLKKNPNGTDGLACARFGSGVHVTKNDAIVNRIVSALDYLSTNAAIPPAEQAYWKSFLISNKDSPYVLPSTITSSKPYGVGAYPDWSKIILAGHSQGGGHAAYLAMNLTVGVAARRVNLFSSPQDSATTTNLLTGQTQAFAADWISLPSATPMINFWGFRNYDEGIDPVLQVPLGDQESSNWSKMGGASSGGVGESNNNPGGMEFNLYATSGVKADDDGRCLGPLTPVIGPGACQSPWQGQQRYVSWADGNPQTVDPTLNHDSTALGCSTIASDPNWGCFDLNPEPDRV